MTRPTILAIDPGSAESAWLLYVPVGPPDGYEVRGHGKVPNEELRRLIRAGGPRMPFYEPDVVAIEQIEPRYGLQAGWEVLDTARWVGRFEEAAHPLPVARLKRSEILRHLGVATHGKREGRVSADSGVRAALMDRFGGKEAIGRKHYPGPLYGITGDVWAALAVAVTHQDQEALSG